MHIQIKRRERKKIVLQIKCAIFLTLILLFSFLKYMLLLIRWSGAIFRDYCLFIAMSVYRYFLKVLTLNCRQCHRSFTWRRFFFLLLFVILTISIIHLYVYYYFEYNNNASIINVQYNLLSYTTHRPMIDTIESLRPRATQSNQSELCYLLLLSNV